MSANPLTSAQTTGRDSVLTTDFVATLNRFTATKTVKVNAGGVVRCFTSTGMSTACTSTATDLAWLDHHADDNVCPSRDCILPAVRCNAGRHCFAQVWEHVVGRNLARESRTAGYVALEYELMKLLWFCCLFDQSVIQSIWSAHAVVSQKKKEKKERGRGIVLAKG